MPVRTRPASDDGGRLDQPGRCRQPIPQAASQGLLTLSDGTVLSTFETFKAYDEPGRWVYRGGLVRSDDEGRTWREPVISAVMSRPHGTMWWDPRIAQLADGRLVQLYYAYEHDRGGITRPAAWSSGMTAGPGRPHPDDPHRPSEPPDRVPGRRAARVHAAPDGAGSMVGA